MNTWNEGPIIDPRRYELGPIIDPLPARTIERLIESGMGERGAHLHIELIAMLRDLRGIPVVRSEIDRVVWPLVKPYWVTTEKGVHIQRMPIEDIAPLIAHLAETSARVSGYIAGAWWNNYSRDDPETYLRREVTMSMTGEIAHKNFRGRYDPQGLGYWRSEATLARLNTWRYELRAVGNGQQISAILPNKVVALIVLTSPNFLGGAFNHLVTERAAW